MDPVLVQTTQKIRVADHENDTDDMPEGMDPTLIQINSHIRDHENDTEDIPEGQEPTNVHLRDQDGGWLNPEQIKA